MIETIELHMGASESTTLLHVIAKYVLLLPRILGKSTLKSISTLFEKKIALVKLLSNFVQIFIQGGNYILTLDTLA